MKAVLGTEKPKWIKAAQADTFYAWTPFDWQFSAKMPLMWTNWKARLHFKFMVRNSPPPPSSSEFNVLFFFYLGFGITFFISRLVSNGIYAFYEVAHHHFPESLEDLPSFISLKNITLLLAVNDVFWRLCKKSDKAVTITNRYKETVGLERLIGVSQDCTRTCAMRYGQWRPP